MVSPRKERIMSPRRMLESFRGLYLLFLSCSSSLWNRSQEDEEEEIYAPRFRLTFVSRCNFSPCRLHWLSGWWRRVYESYVLSWWSRKSFNRWRRWNTTLWYFSRTSLAFIHYEEKKRKHRKAKKEEHSAGMSFVICFCWRVAVEPIEPKGQNKKPPANARKSHAKSSKRYSRGSDVIVDL